MPEILTESIIASKAIKIISRRPGINTSELIVELQEYFVLHDDDLRLLNNRNDTYFSQKVRNLVSHYDSNEFGRYTVKGPIRNRSTTWTLNQEGNTYVSNRDIDYFEDVMMDEAYIHQTHESNLYNDETLLVAENRQPVIEASQVQNRVRKDPRIAKTYLRKMNYVCQHNFNHKSFTSNSTKENYVEAHHLIPIKAQIDYNINLDRSENLVSLCPICHKEIHLGISFRVKLIVSRLLEIKENDLRSVGLDISLNELFYSYYT